MAPIAVVLHRRYILQHRIDASIENIHDFVRLKRAMTALLALGSRNIQLYKRPASCWRHCSAIRPSSRNRCTVRRHEATVHGQENGGGWRHY